MDLAAFLPGMQNFCELVTILPGAHSLGGLVSQSVRSGYGSSAFLLRVVVVFQVVTVCIVLKAIASVSSSFLIFSFILFSVSTCLSSIL